MAVTVAELAALIGAGFTGDGDTPVAGISLNAQSLRAGEMFAALPGARAHGASYAQQGDPGSFLTDAAGEAILNQDPRFAALPKIVVDNPRQVLGEVSSAVYGNPSHKLTIIGVTGTSGKTTTSYLMERCLMAAGYQVGLIGTTGTRIQGRPVPTSLTTPEAPVLHALFAQMLEEGVTHVVMEVSSHAIMQGRIGGVRFAARGFNNLSQDHLDFHNSMEEYFEAKASWFTRASGAFDGAVVINIDDEWGRKLEALVGAGGAGAAGDSAPIGGLVSISTTGPADYHAGPSAIAADGSQSFSLTTPYGVWEMTVGLPGRYNVANAMMAVALIAQTEALQTGALQTGALQADADVADGGVVSEEVGGAGAADAGAADAGAAGAGDAAREGADSKDASDEVTARVARILDVCAASLASVPVPGRMEKVSAGQPFLVVVDYAHKPAAIEAALATLREQVTGRLAIVVGAGGDRDHGKRPMMGAAAATADLVVICDDNPRSEDPASIRAEVLKGAYDAVATGAPAEIREIGDRAAAIAAALEWAREGDAVIIAGKGHETAQTVGETVTHFDDREVAREALAALGYRG